MASQKISDDEISIKVMAEPIVTLPDGDISGRWRTDTNGRKFLSFEGIPYGDPPVGELRFKAPVPVKPWKGVKDCTRVGPGSLCNQPRITQDANGKVMKEYVLEGAEDCLNLNVYTRQLKSSSSKPQPVMVYIHGGAYVMGNTNPYGPERLLTQDIVLVQLHYRMGAFGFLAMNDPELGVSGNSAMKDKILALKWVQTNIRLFNGDPHNVTIFGHSAGACSVALLTLSPQASGLFHKAILQSISALSSALRGEGNNSKKLAEALSCEEKDEKEILRFLQSLPAEKIFEGQLKLKEFSYPSTLRIFSPVVESQSSKDPFLAEDPIELLKTGRYNHVPTMLGFTEMESIQMMDFDDRATFNADFFDEDTLTPVWFGFEKGSVEFKAIAKKIRKFYYGDSHPEFYSLPTVNMISDMTVIWDMIRTSKYLAKTSREPTFLYEISLSQKHDEKFSSKNLNGATHAFELPYLFKMGETTDETMAMIAEKFVKLWTNFAKYGNPTAKTDQCISLDWKPVTKEHLNYLDIGEDLTLRENPEAERMAFWHQLYQSYPQTEDGFEYNL